MEHVLTLFYSIGSGLLMYLALILIKQKWVNTIHYLLTFLLLPPIAFVITSAISNNLALSLGMIGALSIIRFRTPVKNPLELVIFFALITSGISFGVNEKWGILLVGSVMLILVATRLFAIVVKKYNLFNLFNYSFSTNDGELKSMIEVESSNKIEYLEDYHSIVYQSINENRYYYKISVSDKSLINSIKEKILLDKNVISIEVRYGD